MRSTKKMIAMAAVVLLMIGLFSSCRASRCGGCPTFSIESLSE